MATELNIEDQILTQPWAKDIELNPLLETFFIEILPKLTFLPTSIKMLQGFTRKDIKAEEVAVILRSNPYFEEQVGRFVDSIAKRQDKPSLEAAVVMLGMQNSRNLVLAMQLKRNITDQHPVWDQNGKLSFAAKDVVKCALKVEEPLAKDKDGYVETVFAAGLLFDYVAALAETRGVDKKVLEFMDVGFKHATRAASLGKELQALIPDFSLKKFAYSACLLHNIGQLVLAILDANYVVFLDEAKKKETPNLLIHLAEKRLFGVTSAELTALICRSSGVFSALEVSARHQAFPCLLKDRNKQSWQMATLMCMANAMSRHFKKTADTSDPIVTKWKAAELGDFSPTAQSLYEVVAKITI